MLLADAYSASMLARDVLVTLFLAAYTYFVVVVLARKVYASLARRAGDEVAVYVSRKTIHIAAAGVVSLLLPYVLHTPVPVVAAGFAAAALLHAYRAKGRLMRWFQLAGDESEVSFVFSWSAAVLAVWLGTGNSYHASVPGILLGIGDGVTGFARAAVAGRRVKHWSGTLAMLAASAPLAAAYGGCAGVVAAVASTAAEALSRRVDDNIVIAIVAASIMLLFD